MTDDELAEIDARCAALPEGDRWRAYNVTDPGRGHTRRWRVEIDVATGDGEWLTLTGEHAKARAQAIAAAPEDVRRLLAEVREARAEVARLRGIEAAARPVLSDLRDLVRHVDRPRTGMGASLPGPELASAARLPSVVTWARRAVRWWTEAGGASDG